VIDLHTHSTASDGSLTPAALIDAARLAGLRVLSITDHDTTAGFETVVDVAARAGVELVPGIEISAVAYGRDVHILGYFIDPSSFRLRGFLERQRTDRIRRVEEMTQRLAALGCPISADAMLATAASGRSVGRPQIAAALVDAGYVQTRDEAFERFLEHGGPAYVPRHGASPEDVVAIVHAAGGLASLAHPGVTRRDDRIEALAAAGLDALEARHSDHDAATEQRYRDLARERGLLVTGGSDFHGEGGHRVPRLGVVSMPDEDYTALQRVWTDRRPRA
jgi:predicted metal-dependent phosphoesterase TrpH